MSFATSVNGRLVVVKSDDSKLSILVQINTNSGEDDLGGATIVLSFDNSIITFNSNPESGQDYIFHNFSSGNYNEATVTKPLSDKIWINIDLPKENINKGKVVADTSNWTDVVTLNFSVINIKDTARVKWMHSNIFWQVYDADNSTSWMVGKFTDLVIAPPKIELLSFTATLLDDTDIKLDWSTISYEENLGYEIYKTTAPSTSPSSKGGDIWERIGFVESQNTLNTSVNYSFVDEQVNISQDTKYHIKLLGNSGYSKILGEVEIEAVVPEVFSLEQNYPNPFNPSTKIRFTVPTTPASLPLLPKEGIKGSFVNLKVYDVLGEEVVTLINEFKKPGIYEVEFDAIDLSSGIYFYRLETPTFSETKKMILLR